MIRSIILIAYFLFTVVDCHIVKLGDCPPVEPLQQFDIDRFLGTWYVVQKFRTSGKCLTENITKIDGEYFVNENLIPIGVEIKQKGKISFDPEIKAKMKVSFPITYPLGDQNYWVVMTDYDNYAAVWSCQKIMFAHRMSAHIMSRTPKIDLETAKKIRAKFEFFGVDEHDFSYVDHSKCDYDSQRISNTQDTNLNVKVGPVKIST